MIKEKLEKLYNRNLDKDLNNNILYMNEHYDENSLKFILSNAGFKINDNIILRYHEQYGFRCQDLYESVYGKSPLSQNIERFLNRKQKL